MTLTAVDPVASDDVVKLAFPLLSWAVPGTVVPAGEFDEVTTIDGFIAAGNSRY